MSKASLLPPLLVRELKLCVSYKTIYTGRVGRYGTQGLLQVIIGEHTLAYTSHKHPPNTANISKGRRQ